MRVLHPCKVLLCAGARVDIDDVQTMDKALRSMTESLVKARLQSHDVPSDLVVLLRGLQVCLKLMRSALETQKLRPAPAVSQEPMTSYRSLLHQLDLFLSAMWLPGAEWDSCCDKSICACAARNRIEDRLDADLTMISSGPTLFARELLTNILHRAVAVGHVPTVRTLLKHGAEPAYVLADGRQRCGAC